MTDLTNQDRRAARAWAKNWQGDKDDDTSAAARVILATVDAPAPTLAEELRGQAEWARRIGAPCNAEKIDSFAAHAAQMEHDLAEAHAEVERLTAERYEKEVLDAIDANYDHYAAQKGAESNAKSTDPADVPAGEAWIVECRGERRTAVKDNGIDIPWNTINADGWYLSEDNENVTLATRLVPAPRVITNRDELDLAKRCTVIRDAAGVICERDVMGDDWSTFTSPVSQKAYIVLPATVLWEPEA